jgi:hypothetical protein
MVNAPDNELNKEHIFIKTRISYIGNSDYFLKYISNTAIIIDIDNQKVIRVVRLILKIE